MDLKRFAEKRLIDKPMCEVCNENGVWRFATKVVLKEFGLGLKDGNLMSLCDKCYKEFEK